MSTTTPTNTPCPPSQDDPDPPPPPSNSHPSPPSKNHPQCQQWTQHPPPAQTVYASRTLSHAQKWIAQVQKLVLESSVNRGCNRGVGGTRIVARGVRGMERILDIMDDIRISGCLMISVLRIVLGGGVGRCLGRRRGIGLRGGTRGVEESESGNGCWNVDDEVGGGRESEMNLLESWTVWYNRRLCSTNDISVSQYVLLFCLEVNYCMLHSVDADVFCVLMITIQRFSTDKGWPPYLVPIFRALFITTYPTIRYSNSPSFLRIKGTAQPSTKTTASPCRP